MKSKIHALAGGLSFLFIAVFWVSTLVSELLLSLAAVTAVKVGITYAFIVFIPCMVATGSSGFAMGGKSTLTLLISKRRRMPFIALNGLLVLIPAALYLSSKARVGEFDAAFYSIQGLELLAGAINLFLMGLNIRDGRRISQQRLRS